MANPRMFRPFLALVSALWILAAPAARAFEVVEEFGDGARFWLLPSTWTTVRTASGSPALRGDSGTDSFGQLTVATLGRSWKVEVDLTFRRYGADGGRRALTAIALFPRLGGGVQFEANLGGRSDGNVQVEAQWFNANDGSWNNILNTGWIVNRSESYTLQLIRREGSDRLVYRVVGTNGFVFFGETTPLPAGFLDRMTVPGLRADNSTVDFHRLRVVSPHAPAPGPVIVSGPTDRTVVAGSTNVFEVVATGARPLRYQWFRGTTRLIGQTNRTYVLPRVGVNQSARFSVQVDDEETAVRSAEARLTVVEATLRHGVRTDPAGLRRLGFDVVVGRGTAFRIQSSRDLRAWEDLSSHVGTGAAQALDGVPLEGEPGPRFFRISVP